MDVVHGNFIWNLYKERANILKHRVDFTTAALVFDDPAIRIFVDVAHSQLEERHYAIGRVEGKVLTVRFTYREHKIRIIGAGYWRRGKEYYEKPKEENR